jgi:hypothetical protein
MKIVHVPLLGVLVIASGCVVQAATVSPDTCSTGTPPVGSTFSFMADSLGGTSLFPHAGGLLDCMFMNVSGLSFNTLTITTPLTIGKLSDYTCGLHLFNNCSVTFDTNNNLVFKFSVVSSSNALPPGIPNGAEFAIDLGTTGFAPNQAFQAVLSGPVGVPEPGSAMFVLIGVGAIVTRRHLLFRLNSPTSLLNSGRARTSLRSGSFLASSTG